MLHKTLALPLRNREVLPRHLLTLEKGFVTLWSVLHVAVAHSCGLNVITSSLTMYCSVIVFICLFVLSFLFFQRGALWYVVIFAVN